MTAPDSVGSYEQQLAERAAELLPGIGLDERLELLAAMDPDETAACLAWLAAAHPQVFDHALVRDREMVGRLIDRLDEAGQDEDCPQPYCTACGASVGIFIGHGDAWLHYSGEGTAASPAGLFDAGHEPAVAWRGNGRYACCKHCTHGEAIPAGQHSRPCHGGCNDAEDAPARGQDRSEAADIAWDRTHPDPYRSWVNGEPPAGGEA